MKQYCLLVLACLFALLCFPPQWYPMPLRLQLTRWFGADSYHALPESKAMQQNPAQTVCPDDLQNWRSAQTIAGIKIRASETCNPDNPFAIAAFVRGTNKVGHDILMKSGLTPDAVEKGADLDGDGDPDEITIRLEVAELNGSSPDNQELTTQYAIAPGIKPGLWVFTPKTFGMATENFESPKARPILRLPSPAIRVEQGDRIKVILENSHYMPHTIHFHGVDHAFQDKDGEGNDGVPITSEKPVMPGKARVYDLQPRTAGTMFYHCHVQPHVHIMMGLQGIFVVEENRADNWLQTLNIGSGQVRVPSVAVKEKYTQEYDLHYLDIDKELNNRIQQFSDPRLITQTLHRDYNITNSNSDFYTLNGLSFPYTFQDSLLVVKPNERVKLRIANGGRDGVALHTHGHKATLTHTDGVAVPPPARITRDVFWIASAQRIDLELNTSNDGLHSYGSGVWLFHDHQGKGTTTDGIAPGGHISAIVYKDYLNDNGWPKTFGINLNKFFTERYYRKEIPIWESYSPSGIFSEPKNNIWMVLRILGLGISLGTIVAIISVRLLRYSSSK